MPPTADDSRRPALLAALVLTAGLLVWSGIAPYDRATWLMEVAPVLIVVPVLLATCRRFPLTSLLYACIALHAAVLMLGGAYTYARVPLGFQIADWLGLQRNPYDRIGHFFQGFVPALAAREILLRGHHVQGRRMLAFLVVCTVLAISATYEFIEWGAALALGQGADEFLGTQGDPWDTQSDMFAALIGAVSALLLLSGVHDRQLQALADAPALAPLPPTPTGRYRHHKGNEYEVLGAVRHSETLEPLVLYRPLGKDTGDWVRPHAMFFETVSVDGRRQPRFAPVDEPAAADAALKTR